MCSQPGAGDVRNTAPGYLRLVSDLASTTVALPDVELACLTSPSIDDRDRPLVVCMHGFPDSAYSWRHLMPALDGAGFRVVTPFIRGYAPSSVSTSGAYQTGASSIDACAIHDHFGGDARAALVGHDWGAPIVYGAASLEPERWSKLVAMAVQVGKSRLIDNALIELA